MRVTKYSNKLFRANQVQISVTSANQSPTQAKPPISIGHCVQHEASATSQSNLVTYEGYTCR